ncbi:acetylxylan esterase [Arthrobacter sp. CJ23]|uniref:acetylxylan esterase n=1 Tax=Arthrobacter sp. CJ23 TaxID=2972479 RepID=UPI00215C5E05|nr:acetylxylan esterase [Arthrobacter sp. CJ23]UVJ38986.1 acetylxylan esterase [Arthrobacter sp. CJ23]
MNSATSYADTETPLRSHHGQFRPEDFDSFWLDTLAEADRHPLDLRLEPVESPLRTIDVFDLTFAGFGGEPVKGWLRLPRARGAKLQAIVEYVGYGSGRGHHIDNLLWSSAGYAHLTMDTRGQGSSHSIGHTPDPHGSGPSVPGFATRGIAGPGEYYYRRVITDAVRAVAAVRTLECVDASRVAPFGASQGGGIALAVAGLVEGLSAVVAKVPCLSNFPLGISLAESGPYTEIAAWLRIHAEEEAEALHTLSYFDAVNFVERATAPALFSAALKDMVCPAPTVYSAHDAYAGEKSLNLWKYSGHEGGGVGEDHQVLGFLEAKMATSSDRSSG